MKNYLVEAIQRLTDNSTFSIYDNDYTTIVWDELKTKAPTQAQINQMIETIKSEEANKSVAKNALLERLGITAEEAALLLS